MLGMQLCVVLRRDFVKDQERRFASDTSPHSIKEIFFVVLVHAKTAQECFFIFYLTDIK